MRAIVIVCVILYVLLSMTGCLDRGCTTRGNARRREVIDGETFTFQRMPGRSTVPVLYLIGAHEPGPSPNGNDQRNPIEKICMLAALMTRPIRS